MLDSIKDFIFPKLCFCNEPTDNPDSLCDKCWKKLDFISSNCCSKCGIPQDYNFGAGALCPECIKKEPHFDIARSVFKYDDFSGKFITLLKYADKTHLVEMLSKFLVTEIRNQPDFDDYDIITSVPIHQMRLLGRKFNQSALLANKISSQTNIECNNMLLKRVKNVVPQTGLKRKHRLKNVKGVFDIVNKNLDKIKNARVIIIDDVYTTGATLNECAKVLKLNGAEKVFAVTIARTLIS